jgi:hypothetical protein
MTTIATALHRKSLEKVIEEKDIGVVIQIVSLHYSSLVKSSCSIVESSLDLIILNILVSSANKYKSLVRTHLDYASSVWAPFKAKHIEQIEWVQRRATKQIPGFRDMTYSERLRALKLPSLSYRRLRGDMIEVRSVANI